MLRAQFHRLTGWMERIREQEQRCRNFRIVSGEYACLAASIAVSAEKYVTWYNASKRVNRAPQTGSIGRCC